MVDRVSALDGHLKHGRFGTDGVTGVTLSLVRDLEMHQIAAWADTIDTVGEVAAAAAGAESAPGPGQSSTGSGGSLLRIEPMKWWLVGADAPELSAEQGSTVDLSHSRTRIRIQGDQATALLNRLLPLDLRENKFPINSVASSMTHHVGVTLWRTADCYELFIPRGFALSVWEVLYESALQFGVEVA